MSKVKLYEGCWVKTRCGYVLGPVQLWSDALDGNFMIIGHITWYRDGKAMQQTDQRGAHNVIAVYDSLAEASASNPDM